jgi:hypothetical protein
LGAEADPLASQDLADVKESSSPFDLSIAAHAADSRLRLVFELKEA